MAPFAAGSGSSRRLHGRVEPWVDRENRRSSGGNRGETGRKRGDETAGRAAPPPRHALPHLRIHRWTAGDRRPAGGRRTAGRGQETIRRPLDCRLLARGSGLRRRLCREGRLLTDKRGGIHRLQLNHIVRIGHQRKRGGVISQAGGDKAIAQRTRGKARPH